jgi:hypothetical protein
VWANPGHSTLIDYDHLFDGNAFADAAKGLGADYVYFNLGATAMDHDTAERWVSAAGIVPNGTPYSPAEKATFLASFENRYLFLVADAVRDGRLTMADHDPQGRWVLFKVL